MAGRMEEVLLIGSLDAGKLEFRPGSLELGTFLRRPVDEVLSATNRRCPIDLFLADILGDVQADERLLRHIFTNLLTNVRMLHCAGRPVQLQVGCDGTEILWAVRDQGIGIPESDRE